MKPFVIKNPNKIYTQEELQKDSAYPLFEDFYIGENPDNLGALRSYKKNASEHNDGYRPLEYKYVKLLPEYMQFFSSAILIGPDDDVRVEMALTPECIKAIQLRFELKRQPTKDEIIKILKKDMDEFYKKFGAEKALRAIGEN